jgi:aspartate kinase
MQVFKFGGASVKNAEAVKNVAHILGLHGAENILVVVSAMGKTTNELEKIVEGYINQSDDLKTLVDSLKKYHSDIVNQLFNEPNPSLNEALEKIFGYLEKRLTIPPSDNFDLNYDQIVPVGELLSTKIIASYLNLNSNLCQWVDARKLILTDSRFRKANIDWELTEMAIQGLDWEQNILVTQGFIGGTKGNFMTTLGREGSDFTAAIFANALNAKSVTIWKDVPGVLNADPKYFNNTEKLEEISYKEAIELAYYGASVIHPKTIKPLQNKKIPLHVKSFLNPEELGTVISENFEKDGLIPCYIFKTNQVLVSFSTKDFAFISEKHISQIFDTLYGLGLEVNTMQNSAINFSINTSFEKNKLEALMKVLENQYAIKYNDGLDLLTIRHYNDEIIKVLTKGRKILLEQRSRNTVRLLMR